MLQTNTIAIETFFDEDH